MFVPELVVFEDGFLEDAFFLVAVFFEDAHGGGVVLEDAGVNAGEFELFEAVGGDEADGFGGDAFGPVGFADPVAYFGGFAIYIVLGAEADDAAELVVIEDGKVERGALVACEVDEELGIFFVVGMGHEVAEVIPNLFVVGQCGHGDAVGIRKLTEFNFLVLQQ